MSDTRPASILHRPGDDVVAGGVNSVPGYAADLHLDEVAAALARDGGTHAPDPRFHERLREPDAIAFRHEVFRDLEDPRLTEAVRAFTQAMRVVHDHLARASTIPYRHERHRWHLEAAGTYCAAVPALAAELDRASLGSRGLTTFRDVLGRYLASEGFAELRDDTERVLAALAGVTYRLRIGENRITVLGDDGEADYGAEIRATFARFRTADAQPLEVDVFDTGDMNPVEAGVLDRVARMNPGPFRDLDAFAERHVRVIDPVVGVFAKEAGFYLAWLDLIAPLRDAGLPFCYPEVSAGGRMLEVRSCFDLALALRRTPVADGIVTNDVRLEGPERILVITGPNQGGKTTFARALGQLYHLAGIGCPVPAAEARVPLADAVHTLFARPEDASELAGRLEAELRAVRAILDGLTSDGVVIVNEGFASTTVDDALALTRELFREIAARGATCVAVTFLGELASFDATTVSMACVMEPDDPTRPTFRIERRPADDLAHAHALADAHHLGYAAVVERLAR